MSTATITARSQQSLKRLVDEPLDDSARWKQARQTPQPASTGLSAWHGPRRATPNQPPSRVGQYTLLERYEGEELYRAEHSQTREQFTCQVLGLQHNICCSRSDCSAKAATINITCEGKQVCVCNLLCTIFPGSFLAELPGMFGCL